MRIRDEQPGDFDAIHELVASAFPTDAEARLVDLLRAAGRLHISLVAVQNERLIGHVAFSPVTTANDASSLGVGLAPLTVAEPARRRGVGAALVRAALQQCRESGPLYVVVLGEPEYYKRFGFRTATAFGLYDAYGGGAAFQILELHEGGAPRDGGLVQYAPEFALFDGDTAP